MKMKKRLTRHTKIIAVCVICLTIITISSSYAIFFSIKTNSNNQKITTGTLSVVYGTSSTTINNGDMLPLSDTEGLAQENNALIYVQNNGSLNSSYTITAGYDYSTFTGRTDYDTADMLVPLEYLRMAIYEYNTETSALTQIGGIINLGDLPVYSVDTNNKYNNKYSILFGSLGSPTTGNSTKTYAIKVWIDEDASECISGYYVYLKLDVNSGVTESKMSYTINGVVKDSASTVVNGATVSLLNNSTYATTNTAGVFSWSNVREGTYLVKVTTSDATEYTGTLSLAEGSSVAINQFATSHVATTGNTLASLAYTYGTTQTRVKAANSSLILDTNATALTVGNSYVIPSSYQLTGGNSSTISGLTINLGTNHNITSFTIG